MQTQSGGLELQRFHSVGWVTIQLYMPVREFTSVSYNEGTKRLSTAIGLRGRSYRFW